jgi:hypothetical protein
MTLTPTGLLRRHGTTYAGHLDVGPVQYVIDGYARGRDVLCEFRFRDRKRAEGTFVKNEDRSTDSHGVCRGP